MFALNAIHSSLVNNVMLLLAAVLRNSISATIKNNNLFIHSRAVRMYFALLYLFGFFMRALGDKNELQKT